MLDQNRMAAGDVPTHMKLIFLAVLALAGAAVAGVVAHASASKTTVRVTEREYKIGLSAKSAPAGAVVFQIKNTGHYAHELAIAGPGVKKKTSMIKPGKTATLAVTLRSGSYSLWCPIPGHAAQGMKAALTVSGGGSSSSAGAGGATTSGGGTDTSTDSGVPWG
jgi:plastocyanin